MSHTHTVVHRAAPVRLRGDDVEQILPELVKAGSIGGVLVLLIVGFLKEWIVIGSIYRREVARADKMQDVAAAATKALENISGSENLGVALLRSVEKKAAENVAAQEGGDGA